MNADNYENMQRLEKITLAEWEKTVSLHQAWLWFNNLVLLIKRSHFELDKSDVMFGEGDLRERIEWLRKRMEAAEAAKEKR